VTQAASQLHRRRGRYTGRDLLTFGRPDCARSTASGRSAAKFKERYATLGFNEAANLDDGSMWQTSFALTKLTAADESKIAALVKRATR